INMFMEGFHDALLLYALALHEAIRNGLTKKDGAEITYRIYGDFSVMSMTNTKAGTYETVCNYHGVKESFQMLPGFNPDHFTLRGLHRASHTDLPDKSCGLGVSAVTGIIVGALLGTALLMAFYFIRKNYRITIQRRTAREECDIGKHRQLREDSIRSNFSAAGMARRNQGNGPQKPGEWPAETRGMARRNQGNGPR
ncbi:unnamed protein product, partial [Coregonus sp. 'balchen']